MLTKVTTVLCSCAQKSGPGRVARLATLADYWGFESWLKDASVALSLSARASKILVDMERTGICVMEDFWSSEQCAAARAEVDRVIAEYPQYVNRNAKADTRVYGANNASELIARFSDDKDLLAVASAYNHEETITAFTLAARLPASEGNQGSGEGWHRDAFLRQFKAIIYLSDVDLGNGPLQMIRDSHQRTRVLADMKTGGLRYMQYRLDDQDVARILANEPQRLVTYTARAGTVILLDTSAVHRGMPIKTGTRYALTNYYFPKNRVDPSMYEKFDVLPAA